MFKFNGLSVLAMLFAVMLIVSSANALDSFDDFGGFDDLGGDAFSDSPSGSSNELDVSGMSEKEQVDALASRHEFKPENPQKDPFKPIVKKKVVLPPVRKKAPSRPSQPSKPAPPPVEPIRLTINGIVGNEAHRMAIIRFENQEHTIRKDDVVEGKFKVVDILPDRVVVYSNQEQRRHTFRINTE